LPSDQTIPYDLPQPAEVPAPHVTDGPYLPYVIREGPPATGIILTENASEVTLRLPGGLA